MCSKFLMASVLVLSMAPSLAMAEHTRVTNPSAVSVEVLGRGLAYSVDYDQVLNDQLAAGFGLGSFATQFRTADNLDANTTILAIPVYANYYFMKEQGSPFVTAGATILTTTNGVGALQSTLGGIKLSSSPVIPTFGVGYENRGDGGFLFRATAYGLIASTFAVWAGFDFGYAF